MFSTASNPASDGLAMSKLSQHISDESSYIQYAENFVQMLSIYSKEKLMGRKYFKVLDLFAKLEDIIYTESLRKADATEKLWNNNAAIVFYREYCTKVVERLDNMSIDDMETVFSSSSKNIDPLRQALFDSDVSAIPVSKSKNKNPIKRPRPPAPPVAPKITIQNTKTNPSIIRMERNTNTVKTEELFQEFDQSLLSDAPLLFDLDQSELDRTTEEESKRMRQKDDEERKRLEIERLKELDRQKREEIAAANNNASNFQTLNDDLNDIF